MIDVHVHFRDGVQQEKETIKHGFAVAHKAGILSCFDMPNTVPPLTTKEAIMNRLEMGQKAVETINKNAIYRAYAGLTLESGQIEKMVALHRELFPRLVGFKMFAGHSTGNMGIIEKEQQQVVYEKLAQCGYRGVIAVHCEKTSLMREELFDLKMARTHSIARPPIAEVESIKDQIELIERTHFEGHLHICHISTKEGIELVKNAKARKMRISCGATAHHALLNTESYDKLGLLVKMNPPLRDEKDRQSVFEGLLLGNVDWIESDHAPHTLKDKEGGASGIPGFAGTLLLIKALRNAGIDEKSLTSLCGGNANRVFNLDLPIAVPTNKEIDERLGYIRKAYPFDAFSFLE